MYIWGAYKILRTEKGDKKGDFNLSFLLLCVNKIKIERDSTTECIPKHLPHIEPKYLSTNQMRLKKKTHQPQAYHVDTLREYQDCYFAMCT